MKRNLKRGLIIAGIIVAVLFVANIALTVYFFTQDNILKVTSRAMEPALSVNDAIIFDKTIPFDSLEIGDIIVFHKPTDHDIMIVMRIVEVMDDDPLTFRTKGDANPTSILGTDFPITKEEYIGKVTEIIETGLSP